MLGRDFRRETSEKFRQTAVAGMVEDYVLNFVRLAGSLKIQVGWVITMTVFVTHDIWR